MLKDEPKGAGEGGGGGERGEKGGKGETGGEGGAEGGDPKKQSAASRLAGKAKRAVQKRAKKAQRYAFYFALKWTLQVLCALSVLCAVLWAIIQALRVFNVLGISQEPPGLTYFVPGMTPDPPPPPLQILVGR